MARALVLILMLLCPQLGTAQSLANRLFGAHDYPSLALPEAVGSYARGCSAGAVRLPETGATWQAMRLSRNRNWGQPAMIEYLQDLSREAVRIGWPGLYIGDIAQPRGGPMTSGHASHQIGLDADIWMLRPARLNLSVAERENISSISVRTEDQRSVNANWTPQHSALLRAAASDPRVDRVFVAAAVKIEMCRTATSADRRWLQRIRPIAGHNYHFHVRLRCPAGSPNCQTQSPSVAQLSDGGDGCDATLQWWVTGYLAPAPPRDPNAPRPARTQSVREYTLNDLPDQCTGVVRAP
jgi:penicillin-insensitive murein endopeptidase